MYPREPKQTPESKPKTSPEAPKNDRFAEAKKKFEALGQRQGPEPQPRAPRPQPTPTAPAKKESPYGYFQPQSLKPQSPAPTSLKPGDQTLRIPKGEADRSSDNNNVTRDSGPTVSTEPKIDTSRLSGEYGNPKLVAKKIKIEAMAKIGPNIQVERKLASDEHIATGKFIVGSGSNWIQKDEKTDHLIHYDDRNLTVAQKRAIEKSMHDPSKPREPSKALTVSTENKRLVIKPAHH